MILKKSNVINRSFVEYFGVSVNVSIFATHIATDADGKAYPFYAPPEWSDKIQGWRGETLGEPCAEFDLDGFDPRETLVQVRGDGTPPQSESKLSLREEESIAAAASRLSGTREDMLSLALPDSSSDFRARLVAFSWNDDALWRGIDLDRDHSIRLVNAIANECRLRLHSCLGLGANTRGFVIDHYIQVDKETVSVVTSINLSRTLSFNWDKPNDVIKIIDNIIGREREIISGLPSTQPLELPSYRYAQLVSSPVEPFKYERMDVYNLDKIFKKAK